MEDESGGAELTARFQIYGLGQFLYCDVLILQGFCFLERIFFSGIQSDNTARLKKVLFLLKFMNVHEKKKKKKRKKHVQFQACCGLNRPASKQTGLGPYFLLTELSAFGDKGWALLAHSLASPTLYGLQQIRREKKPKTKIK